MVPLLKSCSLQRLRRIQHIIVCSHKPQEATLKWLLCQKFQVPYFGGLQKGKFLTATTWQRYVELQHFANAQSISKLAVLPIEPDCTLGIWVTNIDILYPPKACKYQRHSHGRSKYIVQHYSFPECHTYGAWTHEQLMLCSWLMLCSFLPSLYETREPTSYKPGCLEHLTRHSPSSYGCQPAPWLV